MTDSASPPALNTYLRSLKIFCDVVGLRSFSRAARENGISQSGASQVVRQIEEGLGVRLIDRSKRPFVLTEEGRIYYEGCLRIVEEYLALEESVRSLHAEVVGRVRVAAIYSVGLHHMNRLVGRFMRRFPGTNVRLEYLHPERAYEAVASGHADVGLVSYPKPSRHLEVVPWRTEPMVLVCAPGHPFSRRERLPAKALDGADFVAFDRGLTIHRETARILRKHGVTLKVVMEFDNVETLKRAVEIGVGVGVLPAPTVRTEVEAGTLVAVSLDVPELVRPLGILHRRGRPLGPTTRRFVDFLRAESAGGGSPPSGGTADRGAVAAAANRSGGG